jgi:hypothetical protein
MRSSDKRRQSIWSRIGLKQFGVEEAYSSSYRIAPHQLCWLHARQLLPLEEDSRLAQCPLVSIYSSSHNKYSGP